MEGDIAWVLVSTALVLFMTPGLAFFYGGMVRGKNFLGMLMQNFFSIGLMAVLWSLIGYTIAFGKVGNGGWFGSFDDIGLSGLVPISADGIVPGTLLFAAFQMTFAIITPALITGAVADRMKFGAWVLFSGLWLILVYSPLAHAVFGGGWLAQMGALDFAGGAVVHINAGAAAVAVLLVLGARKGHGTDPMPPHALPWTLLGTGILWFGWFGFNAGSALAADGIAVQAFMNTMLAPAAAMLGWLMVETIKHKKATTLGAASGAVAGMVAITPCAGFVSTIPSLIIGFVAGALCYLALYIKDKAKLDDALDVIAVHLVGGLFGSIILGFFASNKVNELVGENEGVFYGGGTDLLVDQVVASVVTLVFSLVVTFIIAKALDATIGLRVSEEDESIGLDQSQHAETAYNFGELGARIS